ncbi:MAG: antibiotic biosynthesis monooxygenase family protein [Acidobacteriota bacterium]
MTDHQLTSEPPHRNTATRRGYLRKVGAAVMAAAVAHRFRFRSMGSPRPAPAAGKSVQLHIYIETKTGQGKALEELYRSDYVPAIRVQPGFLGSRLLRHYDSAERYEIDITFKSEAQRAAWAQSAEHQKAWPKVEALSSKVSAQGFDVLAEMVKS